MSAPKFTKGQQVWQLGNWNNKDTVYYRLPAPLTSGNLCPDCNGTGADRARTLDARRRHLIDRSSYIQCWACNGNGLDPAAYFTSLRVAAAPATN